VIPQPTPIAVISCVIAVHLSPPLTVLSFQTTSTFVQASTVISAMIAAAIGTVHFSNVWIQ
jgi:hypothetical protein